MSSEGNGTTGPDNRRNYDDATRSMRLVPELSDDTTGPSTQPSQPNFERPAWMTDGDWLAVLRNRVAEAERAASVISSPLAKTVADKPEGDAAKSRKTSTAPKGKKRSRKRAAMLAKRSRLVLAFVVVLIELFAGLVLVEDAPFILLVPVAAILAVYCAEKQKANELMTIGTLVATVAMLLLIGFGWMAVDSGWIVVLAPMTYLAVAAAAYWQLANAKNPLPFKAASLWFKDLPLESLMGGGLRSKAEEGTDKDKKDTPDASASGS